MHSLSTVRFRFHGDLKVFLPPTLRRKRIIPVDVQGHPAVKDTIESCGIPHTEVDAIVVGDRLKNFSYQLSGKEDIHVYSDVALLRSRPYLNHKFHRFTPLKPLPPKKGYFILDVHLGKLARYLRLLGFDTLYHRDWPDKEIMQRALKDKRIILTRDIGLLKNKKVQWGYFVRNVQPEKQIAEILKRFDLKTSIQPFRLCLECNGEIGRIDKKRIIKRLPPHTRAYYSAFFRCRCCRRIYWKGSHYKKLLQRIRQIKYNV